MAEREMVKQRPKKKRDKKLFTGRARKKQEAAAQSALRLTRNSLDPPSNANSRHNPPNLELMDVLWCTRKKKFIERAAEKTRFLSFTTRNWLFKLFFPSPHSNINFSSFSTVPTLSPSSLLSGSLPLTVWRNKRQAFQSPRGAPKKKKAASRAINRLNNFRRGEHRADGANESITIC